MHHLVADDRIEGGIREGELLIIPFRFRSEYLLQPLVLQGLDILPRPAEGDIEGGHDLLRTWNL